MTTTFGAQKFLTAGRFEVRNTSKNPVVRLGTVFPPAKGKETVPVEVDVASERDHLQLRACRALEVRPAGESDGDGDAEGYNALNVDDLQDELRDRGLKVSGSKDELASRLEADDADDAGDGDGDDE